MSVPAGLAPESFAERLYAALAPLAADDDENGWSLLLYVNAIGTMFQLLDELVRDTDEGPGWSVLMDLERCPEEALPWLAQFVGVRLLAGATEEQHRERIASTDGFRRGTRDAMTGAAAATLTGQRKVVFRERDGNPAVAPDYAYFLTVVTYNDETPDPALTEQALLSQKPAGIVLTYMHTDGQDWQQLKTTYATWNAVKAAYGTWNDVREDEPA